MIDLMNKVVRTPSSQLLSFYYPHLYVTDQFLPINNVLYTGLAQNIIQYRKSGYKYIATNGFPEYDLTDRKKHLEFIYSKWNRQPPKYLLEICNLYDEDIFIRYCKEYWLTHVWPEKLDEDYLTVFNLYQDFNRGTAQLNNTFFELLKTKHPGYIEASLLTFLGRIVSREDQAVGDGYRRIIERFRDNSQKNIKPAVTRFVKSNIENRELKLYFLCQDLIAK